MKKILHYLQDTAAHPSPTAAYLAAPGLEPQQRERHRRRREAEHHRNVHNENHYPSSAAHTVPSHVSGTGVKSGSDFEVERHQYAQDHLLQSYDVYIPEHSDGVDCRDKFWVIYIHGGAYRDPKITSSSFHRTLSMIMSSPLHAHTVTQIAGFASLNYRLSPHPDYPQDRNKTSDYELRNAKHPDHINDVLTAIHALQTKYGFGERYLLSGHSVGATLAFQVALSQAVPWDLSGSGKHVLDPPMGVLGLEGIYDFPLLIETCPPEARHAYLAFTRGALGESKAMWAEASPANWPVEQYINNWDASHRLAMVAHSHHDELVDWRQVEAMQKVFRGANDSLQFSTLELHGKHHEIWEKGCECARAITVALHAMMKLDRPKLEEAEFGLQNV